MSESSPTESKKVSFDQSLTDQKPVEATDGHSKELTTQGSAQELVQKEQSDEVPEYYFGIKCWHPKWMQVVCANAKFFTFILCLHGLVEGALVSGFSGIVVSSVERRYRFSSTAVGFLLVSFDLSVLLTIIFISYFGEKRHKPRWIGVGLIVQGIGALVFALPQILFGEYSVGSEGTLTFESCAAGELFQSSCDSSNDWAYFIFLLGNTLIGIGAGPLFTLGLSFIDDITLPQFVPIHMGLFYVAVAIGPAIGYGLGGIFLSLYVDPGVDTALEETDPGWVGAWWIGFVFSGALSLLIAIPFLMYPRYLSNYSQVVAARKEQHVANYTSKYEEEKSLKNQIKAFPIHLWDLCKSKSFMFVTISLAFLFLTLYGLVAFGPKFIESVFNVPASTSSLLAGGIAIPAGGLGTIVGSFIAYCLKANTKRVALIPWITSIFILPALLGFFITCPSLPIAGINVAFPNNSISSSYSPGAQQDVLLSSCNLDCLCNSTIYEPVCGADGLTYFSPCRAGCQKSFMDDETQSTFSNCSCIAENLLSMSESGQFSVPSQLYPNSTAVEGKCPQDCNTLGLWLLLIFVVVFLIFVLRIPTLLITIRSVAVEQRSLALGLQSLVWRALGSIPGPLLFGAIFDTSCVYWQEDCGRRGNCWVYDNNLISLRAFFTTFLGVSMNTICMFLCWVFYPPVTCACRKQAVEPEEKKPQDQTNGNVLSNPVFDPEKAMGKTPAELY